MEEAEAAMTPGFDDGDDGMSQGMGDITVAIHRDWCTAPPRKFPCPHTHKPCALAFASPPHAARTRARARATRDTEAQARAAHTVSLR